MRQRSFFIILSCGLLVALLLNAGSLVSQAHPTSAASAGRSAPPHAPATTQFTDIGAALTGMSNGSVAWGDYNNDGNLDILLTGYNGNIGAVTKVYAADGQGGFTLDAAANLTPVDFSSVAWGDYNNDGKLDILLTGDNNNGSPVTRVYAGDGQGGFTLDAVANLPGVSNSSVAWGDYNNDGKLDILLSGNNGNGVVAQVYAGDGQGGFTLDNAANLPGVQSGSVAWGDYNNDGNLDILLTGQTESDTITQVYAGDGQGGFTLDAAANLPAVYNGGVAWGDYNNDGKLDILLTGQDRNMNSVAQVYAGDGQGGFTLDAAANLPGVYNSSVAWGDYNNDGKLDILLTGEDNSNNLFAKVYRNDSDIAANAPPSAPTGLGYSVISSTMMLLSWQPASDDHTPPTGLSYNLRVGSSPGGSDVVGPMANTTVMTEPNGYRRVVALGNSDERLTATVSGLTPGQTYYWSVQAVDNSWLGGPFAPEASFVAGTAATNTPTATIPLTRTPYPTNTPYPTYTPYPTNTLYPTYTPYPTNTTGPSGTPYPTNTAGPSSTPYPTYTAGPSSTPYPTNTAGPSSTPYPTNTAGPSSTPYPTYTTGPSGTPYPTNTAGPSSTPYPTYTAGPSSTPYPTNTTGPSSTPYPTNTAGSSSTPYPSYTPYPTNTTGPSGTPYPTNTAGPSGTPYPTNTAGPSGTPYPTYTPNPTYTPYPTYTLPPTGTPATTSTASATATNTPAGPTATPQPSATTTDCANPFVDISGNVFYPAIHYLNCRGVVNGTDPTHYTPAGTATRAQFAKVVVLGFGLPLYTPTTGPNFTDVPSSYFAYAYIETGFHAGILSGFDANTCAAYGVAFPCYLPNLAITRGQLTKLVVLAAGYPLSTPTGGRQDFSDVPPTYVFYVSIETAHSKGVINGYPDHTFLPNNPIRRDEMAQIVYQGIITP